MFTTATAFKCWCQDTSLTCECRVTVGVPPQLLYVDGFLSGFQVSTRRQDEEERGVELVTIENPFPYKMCCASWR
jgi:hypothetical protein